MSKFWVMKINGKANNLPFFIATCYITYCFFFHENDGDEQVHSNSRIFSLSTIDDLTNQNVASGLFFLFSIQLFR